jgi:hypothetical protein
MKAAGHVESPSCVSVSGLWRSVCGCNSGGLESRGQIGKRFFPSTLAVDDRSPPTNWSCPPSCPSSGRTQKGGRQSARHASPARTIADVRGRGVGCSPAALALGRVGFRLSGRPSRRLTPWRSSRGATRMHSARLPCPPCPSLTTAVPQGMQSAGYSDERRRRRRDERGAHGGRAPPGPRNPLVPGPP